MSSVSELTDSVLLSFKGSERDFQKACRRLLHAIHTSSFAPPRQQQQPQPTISADVAAETLIGVVTEAKTGPLRRFLCLYVAHKLLRTEPAVISKSIRMCGESVAVHDRLLALLLAFGSERAFQANVANFSHWATTPDAPIKFRVVPGILACARLSGPSLAPAVVQSAEDMMQQMLLHASPFSSSSSSSSSGSDSSKWIPKLTSSTPQQVLEPDGAVSRDCFTVLNATALYSLEQHLNHHVFSGLHAFISSVHIGQAGPDSRPIDSRFVEAIILYCLRVIDQAKLKQSSEGLSRSAVASPDGAGVVAFAEALRLLDLLCSIDHGLLVRLFPLMKRGAALPTSQSDGHVFLSYLQFFLDHSAALVYDVEPFFQKFFDSFLANNYTDQIACFATIDFCLRNVDRIISHTKVFSTYFPSILKTVAWHSFSLFADFAELLPALVSGSSFVELLNSLLDLPLLAAALESQQAKRMNEAAFGMTEEDNGMFRALNSYLLRSQAGVPETFWSQESTTKVVQSYFQSVPVTERVLAASRIVKPLVTRVLGVVLENGTDENLQNLLLVLFHRFDPRQLFPNSDYRREVQSVLLSTILDIFEKHPTFIVALQRPIIELFGNTTARDARGELVLALIWVVGEFLSPASVSQAAVSRDVLNDFYEALELFVFEQMTAVKMVISGSASTRHPSGSTWLQQSSEEAFATRLALVVVGALSKFAARWPFFSSRVVICLSKLAAIADSMHPSVGERTNECIAVLKFPSVAAAVMGSHRARESPLTDSSSPLPFVLQSTVEPPVCFNEEGPLHRYSLHSIDTV